MEAANGIIYGSFFSPQRNHLFTGSPAVRLNRVNQELLIFSLLNDTTSVP